VSTGSSHPLAAVLTAAAEGRFPAADGAVEVLAPDADGTHAVVAFTGHCYALTDRPAAELLALGADGFGGCTHPDVLRWLAGPERAIGSLDVVLVAPARPGERLAARHDLDHHPRVERARLHRRDVRVFGDDRGLFTLGRGLAGRFELSVELHDGAGRNGGAGRALIAAGLAAAPAGQLVWAQVAPGNAASLRAFLACGFVPIGSEVLMTSR
jgi:RimJ/RimL family protein N-acetyltransferase